MDMESRDELKKRGIKRLVKSFGYALDGLVYAFKYEQNMVVHIISMVLAIILGIILDLSSFEWLLVFLIIGLVVATELINTSIEAVVDLISPEKNELAKIAKDTAAAAVMVFAIVSILIAIFIYLPKLINLIGELLWEVALLV